MKLLTIVLTTVIASLPAMTQVNLRFEKYELPSGLTVILHEDHSAPVVGVVVMYHVGSKNEKVKRTGFAHLFEHMMFQGSANVGDDQHFKLLQEIGAEINGSTNEDVTNYYEVVPSNELELALYLEADRMGNLLPAMTQEKLDNQRDVVKNERRQRVDNVPYGTAWEKISKGMYPETHPYSWPVIGYMEDLSAAQLEDIKDFFRTYYAPNNACLSIAGDFDPKEAKGMVEKYFSAFPRGKEIERPAEVPVSLAGDILQVLEDKVQLPRLYISWHSPKQETREDAVMTILGQILSSGKSSRLFRTMVYERQIAQSVQASQSSSEIAGLFRIIATAKPGVTLTNLNAMVDSIIAEVLANGVTQEEIDKVITGLEAGIINRVATNLGKANSMASYQLLTGDPGNINRQMDLFMNITPAEVLAAAKKYLSAPKMLLNVVPQGKPELAIQKIQ
ncbi:MAG TPA: pitrilysin family protein [Bacteroidota bacterium]|nr:pitrilysin family protein [Bacteroidota bacterium]